MSTWKFTDDYLATYPGLTYSMLSFLVFSDHEFVNRPATGDYTADFTGTLDVAATGVALQTIGTLMSVSSIEVSGSVSEIDGTLTVSLDSTATANESFKLVFSDLIPLLGNRITDSAISINTVTDTSKTTEDEPDPDAFDVSVTLTIAGVEATIVSSVPMNGGMLNFSGDFTGLGIELDDLDFLMGSLGEDHEHSWFPNDQLSTYMDQGPELCLLSLTINSFLVLAPNQIQISSVSVTVGLTQLPLLPQKLYMDPLAVIITLSDTSDTSITPTFKWALIGSAKLYSYDNPGPGDSVIPDFEFDFSMGFADQSASDEFSISGALENVTDSSVNKMLQDLISSDLDVGLADDLTVKSFVFETTANTTDGTISSFYTSIDMSGGFGLLENFDFESISISVDYSE